MLKLLILIILLSTLSCGPHRTYETYTSYEETRGEWNKETGELTKGHHEEIGGSISW